MPGVSPGELDRLENAGILELRGEGDTAGYSGADLALLDVLAEVRRPGLGSVFPPAINLRIAFGAAARTGSPVPPDDPIPG